MYRPTLQPMTSLRNSLMARRVDSRLHRSILATPFSISTLTPGRFLLPLAFLLAVGGPLQAQERASIHKVPPIYPEMAKRMHITGSVKVVATVDAAGGVSNAQSDSGNKVLAQAAIDAVKRWKFAPGEGSSTVVVQINFDM